ncbi:hypothetical protein K461DRAFT_280622 [Myriangium duriaei CBS 260.36]|uniref:BHLH domain-containing protein n=1 Tax=Myriangium duriaei CBS 260.36 TaxID=1168546 RepID=A0A9P4IVY6_9PEZI|nr:hypothetical protein K461DRAFT_280622 [Myriangium duriaei CBS 260.36]
MSDSATKTERLTDAQRKQNHIQSERQRREAVRNGFNQLSEIVPGMADQGKSEVRVLTATVDYLGEQLKRKEELKGQCMRLGMSEGDFEQIYRNEETSAEERQSDRALKSSANEGKSSDSPPRMGNGVSNGTIKAEQNGGQSSAEDA